MVTYIVRKAEHDFWGAVPASRDIFGHEALVAGSSRSSTTWTVTSGKAKVTNLQFAVRIDEQVSGFEIAVKDIGRVDIFKPTQSLVNERLKVGISERLSRTDLKYFHQHSGARKKGYIRTHNGMKIGFHEFFLDARRAIGE